jgi:hypothetical protein
MPLTSISYVRKCSSSEIRELLNSVLRKQVCAGWHPGLSLSNGRPTTEAHGHLNKLHNTEADQEYYHY